MQDVVASEPLWGGRATRWHKAAFGGVHEKSDLQQPSLAALNIIWFIYILVFLVKKTGTVFCRAKDTGTCCQSVLVPWAVRMTTPIQSSQRSEPPSAAAPVRFARGPRRGPCVLNSGCLLIGHL